MRPIDLTPEGERSRAGAMRTGPLPFVVIGALAALLVGVAMLVTTSNEISDLEAEISSKEAERAALSSRAAQLQPYVDFQQMTRRRVSTTAELADGRFDWVRTARQLALVIPSDVWLLRLIASGGPGAAPGGGEGGTSVSAPSLTVVGCATGQDAVAAFVAAAKQIDGVTRVGLSNSALPGAGAGGKGSGDQSCPPRSYVARFEAVIAFDAAPVSPNYVSASAASAPEAESPEGEEGS